MNWFDRAIGAMAPGAGLRRARQRQAMAVLARAYEGARLGRRTEGWIAAGTGANAEIAPALARLRDRSRDLVRNNPYAAKAVQALVSNMIGTGLLPRARAGEAEVSGLADRLWSAFAASADADGLTDFAGLQALIVRSLVESGEVLVRLRERRVEDGLPVPLQLQVLEADHLDSGKTEELRDDGFVVQGIEFDRLGRRRAYWLYLLAAQAQKHVTVNEALRLLDGLVQLAVLDRHLTEPPASPADGARYIVAADAVGAWAGWDLNVAYRVDGAWMRLVPRPGWQAWVVDEASFLAWNGGAWVAAGGLPAFFSDAVFELAHDADPTRRAVFDLAAIAAGATRSFALPDVSTELAGLSGAQTFDGDKTFAGELEASGPVATIGTAPGTATYGVGTGATASGATKTVNLGTGGAGGSDTVVNIGSDTPGADGTTVVNTPTVTFANGVTVVGMPQANLTALLLGLGGAVADAWNRLSVNTPAVLLNHAGGSIEATINKNAAGNDAAFAFKTGFSARALVGLLGSDDFSFKVSPDGSTYHEAILVDRNTGRVELPKPAVLAAASNAPSAPAAGRLALYARTRAGQPWLDVMRPNGRDFPLQPHLGINRVATWSPSSGATITAEGMPQTPVGTVSTPGLSAGSLANSMRRWRLTSAATVDSVADQRSGVTTCWRGNAAGLGGWTFVARISPVTVQATGMAFFGLYGSSGALAPTLTLSAVATCIGIGFQRGTHTRWQLVSNDASGAPTLVDMGASFAIATGGVLTLFIAAAPNPASVWVRVVDEVSGAVFEQEVTSDLPAANQFLAPRLFMNNGATAAAVAFDCAGVYLETDY